MAKKKHRKSVYRVSEAVLALRQQFKTKDFLIIDEEGLKNRIPDKQERLTYINTLYEDLGRQLEVSNGKG